MKADWKYYWRRHLGWFPVQFCLCCGNAYWGGFPWRGWQASYQEWCAAQAAIWNVGILDFEQPERRQEMSTETIAEVLSEIAAAKLATLVLIDRLNFLMTMLNVLQEEQEAKGEPRK